MTSHVLNAKDLDALFRRAARLGKEPRYVVHFRSVSLTAEIHLSREVMG